MLELFEKEVLSLTGRRKEKDLSQIFEEGLCLVSKKRRFLLNL